LRTRENDVSLKGKKSLANNLPMEKKQVTYGGWPAAKIQHTVAQSKEKKGKTGARGGTREQKGGERSGSPHRNRDRQRATREQPQPQKTWRTTPSRHWGKSFGEKKKEPSSEVGGAGKGQKKKQIFETCSRGLLRMGIKKRRQLRPGG